MESPADLDQAMQAGMRAYRHRVLWTQTAAALTVAILMCTALWSWSDSRAEASPQGSGGSTVSSGSNNPRSGANQPGTGSNPGGSARPSTGSHPSGSDSTGSGANRPGSGANRPGSGANRPGSGANSPGSFAVAPAVFFLVERKSRQLRAVRRLRDGSGWNATGEATWATADPEVAVVSSAGLVQGRSSGTTTITATREGTAATAQVTVTAAAVLTMMAIEPSRITLPQDSSIRASVTGDYSDGTTRQLSSEVSWSTGDVKVAVVDSRGQLQGKGPGNTSVSATLGDVTATVQVTVTEPEPVLIRMTIRPNEMTLTQDAVRQATAVGRYSDGRSKRLTSRITWSTNDSSVAVVDKAGVVTGTGTGTTTINATQDGVTATSTVSVRDAGTQVQTP
jgi:hypothetical protein